MHAECPVWLLGLAENTRVLRIWETPARRVRSRHEGLLGDCAQRTSWSKLLALLWFSDYFWFTNQDMDSFPFDPNPQSSWFLPSTHSRWGQENHSSHFKQQSHQTREDGRPRIVTSSYRLWNVSGRLPSSSPALGKGNDPQSGLVLFTEGNFIHWGYVSLVLGSILHVMCTAT